MKLTLKADKLKELFDLINMVAGEKGDNSIKTVGLHAIAQNGVLNLHINGHFAELHIELDHEYGSWTAGKAVVDFRKILDLYRSLKDDIDINFKDGWAFCKSGATRFRVPGRIDIQPPPPWIMKEVIGDVDSDWLSKAVHAAVISVAKIDHANLALRSIHMAADGQKRAFIIEASNGAQGSHSMIERGCNESFDIVVPQQCASGLMAMLRMGEKVNIGLFENKIIFMLQAPRMAMSVNRGTMGFPDIGKMFVDDFTNRFLFDRVGLLDVLKRAQLFAADELIKLEIEGATVNVIAQSPNNGEFTEVVRLKKNNSREKIFTIRMNAKNLISCFSEMKSETVELSTSDPPSYLRAKPEGEDYTFMFLVALGRSESRRSDNT